MLPGLPDPCEQIEMRLLRSLPLSAELLKPPEENVIVFLDLLPQPDEESESQHLHEREAPDCREVSDEESLRAEVLLDRPEEVLGLPAFLVPEEDLPGVGGGADLDVRQDGDGSVESIGVEEDEEQGNIEAIRQTHFLERNGGRESLLQLRVVPRPPRPRLLPEPPVQMLHCRRLIHVSVTHEAEPAAVLSRVDPREETALQALQKAKETLPVVPAPVLDDDAVMDAPCNEWSTPLVARLLLHPHASELRIDGGVQVVAEGQLSLCLRAVRDDGEGGIPLSRSVPVAPIRCRADPLHLPGMLLLEVPAIAEEEHRFVPELQSGAADVPLATFHGIDLLQSASIPLAVLPRRDVSGNRIADGGEMAAPPEEHAHLQFPEIPEVRFGEETGKFLHRIVRLPAEERARSIHDARWKKMKTGHPTGGRFQRAGRFWCQEFGLAACTLSGDFTSKLPLRKATKSGSVFKKW